MLLERHNFCASGEAFDMLIEKHKIRACQEERNLSMLAERHILQLFGFVHR